MDKWSVPKMWKDGSCFIIGGGTSMPKQFGVPDHIIQDVLSRGVISEYSDYLSPIHNKHVIGVNMAYQLGKWVSVCYFGDREFFRINKDVLVRFKNLKVTHANLPRRYSRLLDDIKVLNMSGDLGLSENPRRINWNRTSGAAAINFATLAGVKRIYLLGFDMNGKEGRTHWHGKYGKHRISKGMFETYQRIKSNGKLVNIFDAINKDAKRMGVEILNVNPDSAIESFKKVSFKDIEKEI